MLPLPTLPPFPPLATSTYPPSPPSVTYFPPINTLLQNTHP
ncbi:hypothetical protein E2C01_082536 [Portunus trituberculatus]|uniref:Uncharacterized protein n=1 Tax=Portunus trituberculatus TaxID=210409 RepID=A0A5B7J571_PORTR|nr:hypothetical protein [Portunus trituberculatus]